MFTMLYGVGWIVATDTSTARFAVVTAALATTLGLGYLRFVRGVGATAPTAAVHPGARAGDADLEVIVRRLEERLDDAAKAMGPRDRA